MPPNLGQCCLHLVVLGVASLVAGSSSPSTPRSQPPPAATSMLCARRVPRGEVLTQVAGPRRRASYIHTLCPSTATAMAAQSEGGGRAGGRAACASGRTLRVSTAGDGQGTSSVHPGPGPCRPASRTGARGGASSSMPSRNSSPPRRPRRRTARCGACGEDARQGGRAGVSCGDLWRRRRASASGV